MRRSNWALAATMTVDSDINKAPTAGERTNPTEASTPAASGRAMTLYPVADHEYPVRPLHHRSILQSLAAIGTDPPIGMYHTTTFRTKRTLIPLAGSRRTHEPDHPIRSPE
jgi:hypothetical protein